MAERLIPTPDPLDAFARLAHLPYPILLDSAERGPRGRYSYAMADPVTVVRSKGARTERLTNGEWCATAGDALSVVRAILGDEPAERLTDVPPFQAGAAGYIGYDWGATLERVPSAPLDDLALPDVLLGMYDTVVAWDHDEDAAWIVSSGIGGREPAPRLAAVNRLLSVDAPRAPAAPAHSVCVPARAATFPASAFSPLAVTSTFTPDAYRAAVSRVVEYILAGDAFQVNLSQRFEVAVEEDALTLYRRLRTRHAASFSAFVDAGSFQVLSASPERFLRVDGRHVETRPIKGTRPRGDSPHADAALAAELEHSAKDRAENVMIVDLLRNDLSRVCRPGTVRVPELCVSERHPTVHHLVSTITGELEPAAAWDDLLRASFPGGSITGAPKIRAMEIIAELEPTQRGVYCGSIGYISVTGDMEASIAIRTAVLRDGIAYVSAGGGITAQSDPAAEYDETLVKAHGILSALAGR
ncbi:MAG: aminodeoxychorismate synthase component I [Gemmatimonadales bacterium]|nr:aminodeoxychorismate synthase component I [Gemmatimonadales bacterium]